MLTQQAAERQTPRRFLAPAALAALALYAILWHASSFIALRALHYNDFGKFYYSAQRWRDGASMYGPSPATLIPVGDNRAEQFWNMNPPHFQALMWPLLALPIDAAYVVWTLLNVAAAAAAAMAAARALPVRWSRQAWAAGGLALAVSAPALAWAVTGQLTGLLLGAVTLIWLKLRRHQWIAAAVPIGIVCSVKPFLGTLALLLVVRGQWRAALVSAASFAGVFVGGYALFGLEPYREWMAALGQVEWIGAAMNASVSGLVGRAWTGDAFVPDGLPHVIGAALGLALLGAGMLAVRRTGDADRAVLIALVTSLLASPLGWIYYVPVTIGPMLALHAKRELTVWWYVALAGFAVPHMLIFPFPSLLFAATIGSVYTFCLLIMWWLSVKPAFAPAPPPGSNW